MLATSRPAGETSAEARTWTIEAEDYDSALAQARSEVPEGSMMLFVRVDR